MSGQLVGEVLDAAEAGQLDGLSQPARWALVVIAERCHHITRQGSVRRTRIQAALGRHNSLRTVSRAVCELRDAGLIRIVKHGYKAPGGQAKASVYELAKLTPSCWREQANAKSEQANAKSEQANATQDGALDGIYDGSLDGKEPPYPPNPNRHLRHRSPMGGKKPSPS